jgi:signal transduction histidine kinase
MLKRSRLIEALFWIVIIFILSPRLALEFYEYELRQAITGKNITSDWKVEDGSGRIISRNLNVPIDLHSFLPLSGKQVWVYRKQIPNNLILNFARPTFVLGRIGDADRAFLNGCEIGSTGLTEANEPLGWWWSALRSYTVPSECIPKNRQGSSELTIHIYKWYATGHGLFGGPVGIGEFERISKPVIAIEWFRCFALVLFGITMIFSAFYYVLLFVLSTQAHYRAFAFSAFGVGVFEIMTSTIPFRISINGDLMMRVLFVSAVFTASTILWFYYLRLRALNPALLAASVLGGAVALMLGLPKSNTYDMYNVYTRWHFYFLLTYMLAYVQLSVFCFKNRREPIWKYWIGFTALIATSIHDVWANYIGSASPYLISYGFMFLAAAVAMALIKEYSDMLSFVEAQVGQRTHDLAAALNQLSSLTKTREEVVNLVLAENSQVAHDIRSPLSALDAALTTLNAVEEEPRRLIKSSLSRIKGITESLLDRNKVLSRLKERTSTSIHATEIRPSHLYPLIEAVLAEQRIRLLKRPAVTLKVVYPRNLLLAYADVNAFEFTRALSNLINNAVQSLDGQGLVRLSLLITERTIEIRILDNGCGIPKSVLPSIGTFGFSYKKEAGSGLGMHHAKKFANESGGTLTIVSKDNRGTLVRMILPRIALHPVFATSLSIHHDSQILVVSDNVEFHNIFEDCFRSYQMAISRDRVIHIYGSHEYAAFAERKSATGEILLLLDHKFAKNHDGGSLTSQELGEGVNTILVTRGQVDDELLTICSKHEFKILQWDMLPILFGNPAT